VGGLHRPQPQRRVRRRGVDLLTGGADDDVIDTVCDEEGNLARAERAREALAEDIGDVERRSVLNGREQLPEVQSR
jgi:hypothetical protein